MANRRILTPSLDPMAVIEELATGATQDAHGLTLGDVAGHRVDRYYTIWRALSLIAEMARRGFIRSSDLLDTVGAEVQDNSAIDVFQAAHVLPCDFSVNGKPGIHLLLQSPFVRADVERHLFGRTNAVHKLVNYVDSRCEDAGWWAVFEESAKAVIGGEPTRKVFERTLVPGFARAVAAARLTFESRISAAERQGMVQPLLAPNGQPAMPRPQDFRIGKGLADAKARGINKATVLQVFDDYRLGPAGLAPSLLATAAKEMHDWVDLERLWRAKWG